MVHVSYKRKSVRPTQRDVLFFPVVFISLPSPLPSQSFLSFPKVVAGVAQHGRGTKPGTLNVNAGRGYLSLANAMVAVRLPSGEPDSIAGGGGEIESRKSETQNVEYNSGVAAAAVASMINSGATSTVQKDAVVDDDNGDDDDDDDEEIPDGSTWGIEEEDEADLVKGGGGGTSAAAAAVNCANFAKSDPKDTAVDALNAHAAVRVLVFEYHIIFSPPYSVPVLYFNASDNSPTLFLVNSRTLMDGAYPLPPMTRDGVHRQCPLESVASCAIYADVRHSDDSHSWQAAELDGTALRGAEVWELVIPKSISGAGYDPMMTVRGSNSTVHLLLVSKR